VSAELEFVPFHELPPERGAVVELAIPNPDLQKERDRAEAVRARNPFAEIDVFETLWPDLTTPAETLIDADRWCITVPRITLVVGYPFPGQYTVAVVAGSPKGFTRADLFRQIVRVHAAMYEGATYAPTTPLLNTWVESPRFGTAMHRLDDLVVEEIVVEKRADGRMFAWVSIGS
jgi:hypothetical protein